MYGSEQTHHGPYSNLLSLGATHDRSRDFAPVSGIAFVDLILLAHPSSPVASVKDLVALAKSKPGQLAYGSPGHGLSGLQFTVIRPHIMDGETGASPQSQ